MQVDGVVLLDKAAGVTSNRALQQVRRLYDADKAGHTGTLDPFATGLLPICLGEATKFSQALLDSDKVYRATARMGEATDTGDRDGAITRRTPPVALTESGIDEVLAAMVGRLEQVPPMYSALKHEGRPLYRIARAGGQVERAARTITLHALSRTATWRWPDLEFEVCASKGTYVRTLAEQIAEALGTVAHLVALRRLGTGGFRVEEARTFDALASASPAERAGWLLGPDALVNNLPSVTLDTEAASRLTQGRELEARAAWSRLANPGGLLRAYGPARDGLSRAGEDRGRFLGVVALTTVGGLKAHRLLATTPRPVAVERA